MIVITHMSETTVDDAAKNLYTNHTSPRVDSFGLQSVGNSN